MHVQDNKSGIRVLLLQQS